MSPLLNFRNVYWAAHYAWVGCRPLTFLKPLLRSWMFWQLQSLLSSLHLCQMISQTPPPLQSGVSPSVKSTPLLLSLTPKKWLAMYILGEKLQLYFFNFAASSSPLTSSRRCCRENNKNLWKHSACFDRSGEQKRELTVSQGDSRDESIAWVLPVMWCDWSFSQAASFRQAGCLLCDWTCNRRGSDLAKVTRHVQTFRA